MSNMSYCRFQNTLGDLRVCREALDDLFSGHEGSALSDEERSAARALVATCQEIVQSVAEQSGKAQDQVEEFGAIDDTEIGDILKSANDRVQS